MFIQTEQTPNPLTLKFLPGRVVIKEGTAFYKKESEVLDSPLAKKIFAIDGVDGVFFGTDFITVTKIEDLDWQTLKPVILGAIMDYYNSVEDTILEKSLELGADDFESENDVIEITTSKEAFGDVSSGLENEGFEIAGEVGLTPVNSVNVSGNDAKQLLLLLEKLEDHEDIQKVYSNFDLDESEIGSLL